MIFVVVRRRQGKRGGGYGIVTFSEHTTKQRDKIKEVQRVGLNYDYYNV